MTNVSEATEWHNHTVLLELDAGEMDDEPEALWRLFDLLNIACGGHAGDATSMTRVIEVCARHGIAAGAHPSYADRDGFGRRSIAIDPEALEHSIASQCAALAAIASAHGVAITHVKPHGALYHDAAKDRRFADAVVRGARRGLAVTVAVIGSPAGALADAASAAGLRYLREGFADREPTPTER